MAKQKRETKKNNGATVGYEQQLWEMADALRGSMDAAEYKHVVLGLIFLKYISDSFEEQHAKLEAERAQGADPEDPDEYRALSIFWVPPEARWSHLKAQAKQPTIGQLVDDAMSGIERDNASLKGVLPKDYARPALDKQRLGQLIDLISNIKAGDAEAGSKDVLSKLCDPERGITYGIVKVGDFISGGVRVIRGGDIRNGRIVFDAEKKVSKEISRQFQNATGESRVALRRKLKHYNLDAIISVGYRVKSKRGTQFRIWATRTLKDHLLRGYTLNEKRLRERGLGEIEQAVGLLARTLTQNALVTDEGRAVLEVDSSRTCKNEIRIRSIRALKYRVA